MKLDAIPYGEKIEPIPLEFDAKWKDLYGAEYAEIKGSLTTLPASPHPEATWFDGYITSPYGIYGIQEHREVAQELIRLIQQYCVLKKKYDEGMAPYDNSSVIKTFPAPGWGNEEQRELRRTEQRAKDFEQKLAKYKI